MKRAMLALAALLGLGVGLAHAQYVVIVVDVNGDRPSDPNQGAMGAMGMMGVPNNAGVQGNMGGPQPMNMGNMGVPPPGAMGAFGVGGTGALGVNGGFTPPPPMKVAVVVEYTNISKPYPRSYVLTHKWGEMTTFPEELKVHQFIRTRDNKNYPPVSKRYEDEYQKVVKKGTAATTEDSLELARWALEHDLMTKFTDVMDGLVTKDPSNVKVAAYIKVKEQLGKSLAKNEKTQEYRALLFGNSKLTTREHYDLIHWGDEKSPEVKGRLDRLENNYKGYYYWFALRGVVMPMPREKMLSVLVPPGKDVGEEFRRQNKVFDAPPINSDAFYARRQNLIVFSSTRLDEIYDTVSKVSIDLWRNNDREAVLKSKKHPWTKMSEEHIWAQSFSIILKQMEEDNDRAAVGQQGTRQILGSSGLLPRNVEVPEWIQSGMGSLFETPHGSPWSGYGAPHWAHLFSLEDLKDPKKTPKPLDFSKPEPILKKIITDGYFRESMDKSKNHNGNVKARATAWSLTYFLAHEKPDKLEKYFKEISKLPRDLELEEKSLTDCFTRAFGSTATVANEWARFISNVHPDAEDILKELYKLQNELAQELRREVERPDISLPGGGTGGMGGGTGGPIRPGGPGTGGPMGGGGGGMGTPIRPGAGTGS